MKTNNITILYDWDNTLVNTNPVCLTSLNKFFSSNNINKTINYQDLREINNMLFEEYLTSHFTNNNIEEKFNEYRKIYDECADQLILLDYAMPFLSFFNQKGIKQGIISNKPSKVLNKEIERLNIKHYFVKILGGDSAKFPKPSKELMEVMKKEIKIEHDNIIFIGDSTIDLEFAINSNIPIIFVGEEENIKKYQHYKEKIILAKNFNFNAEKLLDYILTII